MLLVRSIYEFPQPIAHKTHQAGLKMVKDLTVARRFIMQKLTIGILSIVDQLHPNVCDDGSISSSLLILVISNFFIVFFTFDVFDTYRPC